MNKQEQKQAHQALAMSMVLGIDYLARALSALHRASLRAKAKQEIEALAVKAGADQSPEWII